MSQVTPEDRIIVLDTETTGLDQKTGDRVVEVGLVEVINRERTGNVYHCYIDPKRDVPEEAYAVHGLARDDLVKLSGGKGFEHFAKDIVAFVGKSPIVAHNAGFDMGFLNHELALCGHLTFEDLGNQIIDSYGLANAIYRGKANNLDALANRLIGAGNFQRDLHGALLDATLLADVYRIMTIKQGGLEIDKKARLPGPSLNPERLSMDRPALRKASLSEDDIARHAKLCERITKASGGECLASSLSP